MSPRRSAAVLMLLLSAALGACSPSLNWRELRVSERTRAWLPCKPETLSRRLPLAGHEVAATMWVCDADGITWSVTAFDVPDAAERAGALQEARHLLAMNLQGQEIASQPWVGGGFDAAAQGRRLQWQGRRPDGSAVAAHAVFVLDDARVLQLVALVPGSHTESGPALDEFFGGLRQSAAAPS